MFEVSFIGSKIIGHFEVDDDIKVSAKNYSKFMDKMLLSGTDQENSI